MLLKEELVNTTLEVINGRREEIENSEQYKKIKTQMLAQAKVGRFNCVVPMINDNIKGLLLVDNIKIKVLAFNAIELSWFDEK